MGLALAFLVEYLDDRVYTKEGLEGVTAGVPVLALVPKIKTWNNEAKVIALENPFSPVVESYRSLRAALQFVGRQPPFRTILITSAGAGEGKTSTAANLGVILANAGKRVVLVDCDLRRPRLGSFLGLARATGTHFHSRRSRRSVECGPAGPSRLRAFLHRDRPSLA